MVIQLYLPSLKNKRSNEMKISITTAILITAVSSHAATIDRLSNAKASATDGILVGIPQDNSSGHITTIGSALAVADASDSIDDDTPPFFNGRHVITSAHAAQDSTLAGNTLDAKIDLSGGLNQKGTFLAPFRAESALVATFEITQPSSFTLNVSSDYADPAFLPVEYLAGFGFAGASPVVIHGDFSQTYTGTLVPGTYKFGLFGFVNFAGNEGGTGQDQAAAQLNVHLEIQPTGAAAAVPDGASSTGLLFLLPFVLMMRNRLV